MTFKKKAVILSALAAVLALIYILTFVFNPQRQNRNVFAWLDPSLLDLADGLEIYGSGTNSGGSGNDAGDRIVLIRKNNVWVFQGVTAEYPVKQNKVLDLFAALSQKSSYPVRARSNEARERLGAAEGSASRILVRGGMGRPLLDLLVGSGDVMGKEVYLRRAGENEIYSGEDRFTRYTESSPAFWYDLRLFPPGAGGELSAADVQQADISFFAEDNESGDDGRERPGEYTLRRTGRSWVISGNEGAELDPVKIETWLRTVLEAEGEDFSDGVMDAAEGNITLSLGNGTNRTLFVGKPDVENSRNLMITGLSYGLKLSEWTIKRLFRESEYFLKEQG